MNLKKILGLAAVAALALMAFASTASAATLETGGVKQSGAVALHATLSGSATLESTSGVFSNTCSVSTVAGTTSVFTGTPTGSVSALSFTGCIHSPVTVHSKGEIFVSRIGSTTNGTVFSSGADVTVPIESIFGSTTVVTCTTNNTDIGELTGVAVGTATIHVNAILECSGILPSARWTATYNLTTTSGAGHAIGLTA